MAELQITAEEISNKIDNILGVYIDEFGYKENHFCINIKGIWLDIYLYLNDGKLKLDIKSENNNNLFEGMLRGANLELDINKQDYINLNNIDINNGNININFSII